METGSILDLVREALPVEGLDEEQLVDVAAATVVQRFPAGTTIIHQGGAPAAGLYVIRTGHVEIRADGLLLDMPGPSEVFGELSLVSGAPPTATVRASEEVECLLIDRSAAESVLGTGSGVAFVQASLRRSLSRSLDTDGRSFVEAIENADDVEAAVSALRELPGGVCSLVAGGADATKVGRVVSSAVDALTRRLLASAIHELGEPPVPWAWLALGSEARLEQALHTDQDHALAYDPGDRTAGELDPTSPSSPSESRPVSSWLVSRVVTGMRWPCIRVSGGRSTPGATRSVAGWPIRGSTAASSLRSCSTSGAWTVRSTPSRSYMLWFRPRPRPTRSSSVTSQAGRSIANRPRGSGRTWSWSRRGTMPAGWTSSTAV